MQAILHFRTTTCVMILLLPLVCSLCYIPLRILLSVLLVTAHNPSFIFYFIDCDVDDDVGSARNDKIDGKDAVDAAKYPDAHRREKELPIERDDWPGPPLPAAAFPEICKLPR